MDVISWWMAGRLARGLVTFSEKDTHNCMCSYKGSCRRVHPNPKEVGQQPKDREAWSPKRHIIPYLSFLLLLYRTIWMNETLDCIYLRKHSWSLWVRWQSDSEVENSLMHLLVGSPFRGLTLILLFMTVWQEHLLFHPWFYVSFYPCHQSWDRGKLLPFLSSICPILSWW